MKKLAKIIGLVVLALVVLGIGVLFFLTRMFDPNDYKEQIQQAAREQANVELTLGGDIGWSLFPWLGIELKQVGLAPIEHPEKTLASVGSMGLGVEVLPLLRKQLRMSDVILDDITLNLEVDENGVANWSTIGPQSEADAVSEEAAEGQAEAEAEADEHGQLDVAVESVRITNARVTYLDRRSAQKVSLEDVNLSTGALIENEPFDVEFLGLLATGQPAMRVRIDLHTVASFDLDNALYQLDGFDLKLDASGDPFGDRAVNMQLQGDSVIDLQKQVAELKQLRLSLADLRATGQLTASQLDTDMQLAGAINVAEFDARALMHALGQSLPAMAKNNALSKVALSADLAGSDNSMMLQNLKLIVDGTELNGSMGLANFERQALRFDLSGNSLNIDHYLPPPEDKPTPAGAAQGGSSSQKAPEPWSNDAVLPLETLTGLNVVGSLDMQQVQLTGQTISPFKTAVEAVDGNVQLKQFEGGIFGGTFAATATINASRSPAPLSLNARLDGIDSLALQRAYEMAEQFRGKLDLSMDLKTQGNSMRRWINGLNGDVRFDVADGALLGVNLEQKLCQAIALANRKPLSAEHGGADTPFSQLGGSFRIVNGNINNRDLIAALPGIAAKGNGDINLPEQRLDYRLGLLLEGDKSDMPDAACQVNERYVGIEWPIRCEGYLHNAAKSCGVDTEGVTRIAGQLLRNEAERKVEDKVGEKLEEEFGDKAPAVRDALKGLFGR
ncbi:AsmA protein [Halopseudomonas litoralis]|uniref:AsmA protein n=1 Tax=Halopseudomonas litoralis TaxID=797277 RepID=A0A1H1VLB7_9GAMM|nr:AsmA family protein [Halopseudomonas litoralis]SDS85602.1 AsmA protein [Halopseudomonas litoralis]